MKTKIILIAVALLTICAYAANSWKATEDTPTAAGTTLIDDELLTAVTIYETTLKSSTISFAEQDFTHFIQVRVSALPTTDNIYGTMLDGSTPISLTAKKNLKLTVYYRRQSTGQTETAGVFAAEDNKDLKCFNQADATQIPGEMTIVQETEDFKYGYATKVYELTEGNSYTLAARGTTIQFFGMTYETTEPAIPSMGVDIILNLDSGKDIYTELAAAMADNKYPGSITINLAANGAYTVSQTLEVNCPLTIAGNADQPATIDASALETPFVLLSKEIHSDFFNENDVYDMGSFIFENIKVTGIKRQFFFANEMKAFVTELEVNNCIIGIDGTAKKTIFDFARGGNTARLDIENSTIYAIPSNEQNGGFFSAQSSQDVPQLGGTTKTTIIKNSTLYGIATGKTISTPRRNNNDYIIYEVKNSIIVDCGKKAQFLKGLNGGQAGNNCTWDIDGNAFQWTEDIDGVPTLTDISADEICGADSALVKNNVVGVVAFANDVTTGDLTLGDCPQNDAKIGDPRWLVDIIPPLGDDIVLNLIEDGKDIAAEVATAMETNKYPKSITVNLAGGGAYTCNNSIVVNCPLTINGTLPVESMPNSTTIDASALEGPMILLSKDIHPGFLNKSEAYLLGSFKFESLHVTGLKRQFFFANEMNALLTELSVNSCIIGIDGTGKKTIFDFARGGNTAMLTITYSTIYAIPSNEQNGGFFSAQSSQDVPQLGGTTKATIIKNSTLYGIAKGKTTSTPRRNNNDYITYEVKNSIIVDCGKKAQFLKGLNGGQPGNNCTWHIDGNSFQWTEDVDGVPTLTDISAEETCGGEVKNNVEGTLVFANDVTTGDFTLGDCPQATAIIGDPRWISQNVGITDVHVNNNDGLWYNLQGVQVPHPIKGIYIQNGKKVVIK